MADFIIYVEEDCIHIPVEPVDGMEQLSLLHDDPTEPAMDSSDRKPLGEIDTDTLIRTGRQANTMELANILCLRSSSPSLRKSLAKKAPSVTAAQLNTGPEPMLNEEDLVGTLDDSQVTLAPSVGAENEDKENSVPRPAEQAKAEDSSSLGEPNNRYGRTRRGETRRLGKSPLGAGALSMDEGEAAERTVTFFR